MFPGVHTTPVNVLGWWYEQKFRYVSTLADLPGHSLATTGMYMTKLECFDEIRTPAKVIFEKKFLEMVFQLLDEIIIY